MANNDMDWGEILEQAGKNPEVDERLASNLILQQYGNRPHLDIMRLAKEANNTSTLLKLEFRGLAARVKYILDVEGRDMFKAPMLPLDCYFRIAA